jgi:DNA-binding IclR family transcriptional regulator
MLVALEVPMAAETSQTLDRGLQVLEVLSAYPSGLNVTDLATKLGISRTILYRLVATLELRGFLRRAQDGKCRIGMATLPLAQKAHPGIREQATPRLRQLAEKVGATAQLTFLEGSQAHAVVVVAPSGPRTGQVGATSVRTPINHRITGRLTEATRTSKRTLEPGWVIAGHDPREGEHAVAAPVLELAGVAASVAVVSTTEIDKTVVGPPVVAAAIDISHTLR